jgi:Sigma 54 modulation/S30EA ribosomal protein C terminus
MNSGSGARKEQVNAMTAEWAVEGTAIPPGRSCRISNAETQWANVVYRRRNGGYGLIEPEVRRGAWKCARK